ncbi:MAG: OmpH family outer membrane protein [Desulfobacterales bacterium]|nr:OmpH family outer membrane protein [Desulfobacterales bacterium]
MKVNLIKMLSILFVFFGLCAQVYGADVAKIGTIDFQRILDVSSAGKEAHDQLNKQAQQMQADLKSKGAEIEEDRKQFERESLVMNKEMKNAKEREVRIKINDFKQLQKKYTGLTRELQFKLVGKIRTDIDKLVKEMGKKKGYLLILERKGAGVVYMPSKIDITDAVVKIYDAQWDKDKKSKGKKE